MINLEFKIMLNEICIMPTNSPGLDLWVYNKHGMAGVYRETIQEYLDKLRKHNEENS